MLETIVWSARDLFPSETDTIAVTYLSLVAHAGYSLGGTSHAYEHGLVQPTIIR